MKLPELRISLSAGFLSFIVTLVCILAIGLWSSEGAWVSQSALVLAVICSLINGGCVGALIYFGIERHLKTLVEDIGAIDHDPELILPPHKSWHASEIGTLRAGLSRLFKTIRTTLRQQQRLADVGIGVAKINHDLRNSLAAATLLTDQLETSNDPNIKQAAPLIIRSTTMARDICQQMLDYLTALPEPQYEVVQMQDIISDAGGAYPVSVDYQGPGKVMIDKMFMSRILGNLARNAYMAGADRLGVDIWLAGHLMVVDVSDNGPGIPDERRYDLFSAFATSGKAGSGLGLSICRDLALAMGGKFYLSRSSDAGSEFRLQLPLGPIHPVD